MLGGLLTRGILRKQEALRVCPVTDVPGTTLLKVALYFVADRFRQCYDSSHIRGGGGFMKNMAEVGNVFRFGLF